MPDLFSVTAPLAIRFRDGSKHIMIRAYPHRDGLLYLTPFWHQQPAETLFHFAPGPLKGDGPWKAGDAVITVLGCHGTDAELAGQYAEWQDYLAQVADAYPGEDEIAALKAIWIENTGPGC